MKLYIVTGEPSGDIHAANLVRELNKKDNIKIRAWGGERLAKEKIEIASDIKDLAFMGILDVLKNIFFLRKKLLIVKRMY